MEEKSEPRARSAHKAGSLVKFRLADLGRSCSWRNRVLGGKCLAWAPEREHKVGPRLVLSWSSAGGAVCKGCEAELRWRKWLAGPPDVIAQLHFRSTFRFLSVVAV